MLARTWILAHRLRRRFARPPGDREQLVREYAPGRSWLDLGCMWSVHGRICFVAEEAGASAVTGVDLIGETPQFQAEHARRNSSVRFVQGDLHDVDVEPHDVVWCSGVLYHVPNPLQTLERLHALTRETLILATEALPELPGVRGASVFYPAADRRAYRGIAGGHAVGLDTPFDPAQGYGNWYWGITPSALAGMLTVSGFEPVRTLRASSFHVTVVARRARG